MLITSHFKLADFSASHFSDLAKMNADPEIMNYFPQNLDFEESAELLKRTMVHHQKNGYALFVLHLTESDVFVGWCGLMVVSFEAHFIPAVEIGWWLNITFWGKELVTEAAKAVLCLGFLELRLSEIISFTAELNQ
jgi:RimJ/RimL family protein N-acetyltransferase